MSDQDAPQPATQSTPKPEVDWNKLVDAVAPHAHEYISTLIDGGLKNSILTNQTRAYLLAGVIVSFTSLCGYSIWSGHIDIAEKIVIALVSFLSGSAVFNSGKK